MPDHPKMILCTHGFKEGSAELVNPPFDTHLLTEGAVRDSVESHILQFGSAHRIHLGIVPCRCLLCDPSSWGNRYMHSKKFYDITDLRMIKFTDTLEEV